MLSKKERLKRVDFSRFFSLGRRIHHRYFTLVYAPHSTPHISVVVSKKVASKAVARNKMRRRVYDSVRNYIRGEECSGVFIFLMKKEAFEASSENLREAVVSIMQKVEG